MILNKWQSKLQQIQQEWQSNPRLQFATFVAAILCVFWVHIQFDNWRKAARADAVAAQTAYTDIKTVAQEAAWMERAKISEAVLKQAESMLWSAATEGEAEAKFRDWLQFQAKAAGLSIDRITVEVGAASRDTIWRPVHADFQGVYQLGAWQTFLQQMEGNKPAVLVDFEQLNVVNPSNLFYRLNVSAWFNIGDKPEIN